MSVNKFSYIESIAFTNAGLLRTNNEDSFGNLLEDGCFFVSDGMGGGEAGEVASQLVEEYIGENISGSCDDLPGNRKYIVQQTLHKVNHKIQQYSKQHGYRQMGATVALLLLNSWDARQALICHVGDSRIYRLRNHELKQLTLDHTIGAELATQTKKKIFVNHKNSTISHVLTRAIGIASNILPEWQSIEVLPEDLFLICSDGVSTMISDTQIFEIVNQDANLNEMSANLALAVHQAGANDNYTFILCKVSSILPEKEKHSKEDIEENDYLLNIAEERIDYV